MIKAFIHTSFNQFLKLPYNCYSKSLSIAPDNLHRPKCTLAALFSLLFTVHEYRIVMSASKHFKESSEFRSWSNIYERLLTANRVLPIPFMPFKILITSLPLHCNICMEKDWFVTNILSLSLPALEITNKVLMR